jgi:hypothetical protein
MGFWNRFITLDSYGIRTSDSNICRIREEHSKSDNHERSIGYRDKAKLYNNQSLACGNDKWDDLSMSEWGVTVYNVYRWRRDVTIHVYVQDK